MALLGKCQKNPGSFFKRKNHAGGNATHFEMLALVVYTEIFLDMFIIAFKFCLFTG